MVHSLSTKMTITYTVYFTDGTSGTVTIERPAGAHPDSNMALAAAVLEAERTGKRVSRLGRSRYGDGMFLDIGFVRRDSLEGAIAEIRPEKA